MGPQRSTGTYMTMMMMKNDSNKRFQRAQFTKGVFINRAIPTVILSIITNRDVFKMVRQNAFGKLRTTYISVTIGGTSVVV